MKQYKHGVAHRIIIGLTIYMMKIDKRKIDKSKIGICPILEHLRYSKKISKNKKYCKNNNSK